MARGLRRHRAALWRVTMKTGSGRNGLIARRQPVPGEQQIGEVCCICWQALFLVAKYPPGPVWHRAAVVLAVAEQLPSW